MANAQKLAIENMASLKSPDDSCVDRDYRIELPGDEDEQAPIPDLIPHLEPHRTQFKITLNRLIEYGETPGCEACKDFKGVHTAECRERFEDLLRRDGKLPPITIVPAEVPTVEPLQQVLDADGPSPSAPIGLRVSRQS